MEKKEVVVGGEMKKKEVVVNDEMKNFIDNYEEKLDVDAIREAHYNEIKDRIKEKMENKSFANNDILYNSNGELETDPRIVYNKYFSFENLFRREGPKLFIHNNIVVITDDYIIWKESNKKGPKGGRSKNVVGKSLLCCNSTKGLRHILDSLVLIQNIPEEYQVTFKDLFKGVRRLGVLSVGEDVGQYNYISRMLFKYDRNDPEIINIQLGIKGDFNLLYRVRLEGENIVKDFKKIKRIY